MKAIQAEMFPGMCEEKAASFDLEKEKKKLWVNMIKRQGLLRMSDAARIMGMTPQGIDNLERRGRIETLTILGVKWVCGDVLMGYMEERKKRKRNMLKRINK